MSWKKGIGKYPGNWEKIKDAVLLRADFKCEICGVKPSFHSFGKKVIIKLRGFRVHHIDRDKGNNIISNLIFVCARCHGKLHRELNNG